MDFFGVLWSGEMGIVGVLQEVSTDELMVPAGLAALGRNALENPLVFQRVGLFFLEIYRSLRCGGWITIRCDGDFTWHKNLQRIPRSKPGERIHSDLAQYLIFKQMDPKIWD